MRAPELMARLNPPNVRYDIGRGGVPDLTAQDIAAAIAMVRPGLGRELICRLWWPDGAALAPKEIDCLLMEVQLGEWRDRADALVTAQLRVEMATGSTARVRADRDLEDARSRMWPQLGGESKYGPIRAAVLAEMSAACRCQGCQGRGIVLVESKTALCSACTGSGRAQVSDRARAGALKTDVANYTRRWRAVYEWTLDLCTQLVDPARREFEKRLSNA